MWNEPGGWDGGEFVRGDRRSVPPVGNSVPGHTDERRPGADAVAYRGGWLDFQEYFVHRRCEPVVHELLFQGAGAARAHPEFLAALADPALQAIVICPSNPFISVERSWRSQACVRR